MKKGNASSLLGLYMNEAEKSFSGADGMSSSSVSKSTPYQLSITNTNTTTTLSAVIFGKNKYSATSGYGSQTGVSITPGQSNVSYFELLNQSGNQPFENGLLRISSTNAAQVTQVLVITKTDANGNSFTSSILPESYLSPDQLQTGRVDVTQPFNIDGNTYITVNILASTTVTMSFFPTMKVDTARGLNDKAPVVDYANLT